ncbi:hypothetical protein [Cyanobium sp. ATX 6F1]|uniref:DUF7734 family protein n=1 Tax=Cyanobium sp. ATX 6F1 TaxID=2823702 RepID=UPI0020CD0501|nr:hypothetical protein [Cyanobium sp. ATX 6F1]MCP9916537.1 hypothetical protein [Cyanobium sp. ATX 6F1]
MLGALEAISREHPHRVLRLRGTLPAADDGASEAFELLIFRGFSSSVTHPTAFDPDQPALPGAAEITAAELLEGPLRPGAERILAGPVAAETFLDPAAWR